MKLPVSLVIITLNEEHNLARCIRSVPFASEVIVVDSHSTDKTVSLAESLGAKVFLRKFSGYRDQKQFAMEQASQPWVLSLDADEALSPMLQDEIQALLMAYTRGETPAEPLCEGYRIPRLSFHLGKWIRHGGWYPDYLVRLFQFGAARWVGGEVHEKMEVFGQLGTLKNDIHHYVFRDLEDQIDTNNEFSTLGANELLRQGKKFSLLKMIFKPIGKFLECFIWKKGFLDGPEGFIIALGAAQSIFLKYAKLWEAQVVAAGNISKGKSAYSPEISAAGLTAAARQAQIREQNRSEQPPTGQNRRESVRPTPQFPIN